MSFQAGAFLGKGQIEGHAEGPRPEVHNHGFQQDAPYLYFANQESAGRLGKLHMREYI